MIIKTTNALQAIDPYSEVAVIAISKKNKKVNYVYK